MVWAPPIKNPGYAYVFALLVASLHVALIYVHFANKICSSLVQQLQTAAYITLKLKKLLKLQKQKRISFALFQRGSNSQSSPYMQQLNNKATIKTLHFLQLRKERWIYSTVTLH